MLSPSYQQELRAQAHSSSQGELSRQIDGAAAAGDMTACTCAHGLLCCRVISGCCAHPLS